MRELSLGPVQFYLSSLLVLAYSSSSIFSSNRDFCPTSPFVSEVALDKQVCVRTMAARRVVRKILSKETDEGVGAKVRRSVGSYEVRWQCSSCYLRDFCLVRVAVGKPRDCGSLWRVCRLDDVGRAEFGCMRHYHYTCINKLMKQ